MLFYIGKPEKLIVNILLQSRVSFSNACHFLTVEARKFVQKMPDRFFKALSNGPIVFMFTILLAHVIGLHRQS